MELGGIVQIELDIPRPQKSILTGVITAIDPIVLLFSRQEQREFRCTFAEDLDLRVGDIVSGEAVGSDDTPERYISEGALVRIGESKETIIVDVAEGARITTEAASDFYDEIALAHDDVAAKIAQWSEIHAKGENEEAFRSLPRLSTIATTRLLSWWRSHRTLRQLALLGLQKTDIAACTESAAEIARICFDDPYRVLGLKMENAAKVAALVGLSFEREHTTQAIIARTVFSNTQNRASTATPIAGLRRIYPHLDEHKERLCTYWGLVEDGGHLALPYPSLVEREVATNIAKMLALPHADPGPLAYVDDRLTSEQATAVERALTAPISIITGPAGSGKCLHPDTPVMLFSGDVKTAGDIAVGDLLMGSDSTPRRVLAKCRGQDPLYRVRPLTGLSFVCNGAHLLTLKGRKTTITHGKEGTCVIWSDRGYRCEHTFASDEEAMAWAQTLPYEDIFEISVEDYIQRATNPAFGGLLWRTSIQFPYVTPPDDPRKVGKHARKNHTRIPRAYLINDSDVRRRTLDGVLSGCSTAAYGKTLWSKNSDLIADVLYLATSLGFAARPSDNVVLVQTWTRDVELFSIERVGYGPYAGFELDGDGRFLLADFTVTHNTTAIKEIVAQMDRRREKFFVCSFTGKAVARLKEVIPHHQPMTIHRLLWTHQTDHPKCVVIDEASMVTSDLVYRFGEKFGWDHRLVLVGDENQLQPISWGTFFSQLLLTGRVPVTRLTKNHRSTFRGDCIFTNAERLVRCMRAIPPQRWEPKEGANFYLNSAPNGIEYVTSIVRQLHAGGIPAHEITIICPYVRHLDALNRGFQEVYLQKADYLERNGQRWTVGDRVMCIENDYRRNIMNGEEGEILALDKEKSAITVEFAGAKRFSLSLRPGKKFQDVRMVQHSFAVTTHKYQGSENKYIIAYIPQEKSNEVFLDWKQIETIMTRAKHAMWFVGDRKQIVDAANRQPRIRVDTLALRLRP